MLAQLPALDHGSVDLLRLTPRYLLDELLDDLRSGHNVGATVYMECGAMCRADGHCAALVKPNSPVAFWRLTAYCRDGSVILG
jgi:hypothetical protein